MYGACRGSGAILAVHQIRGGLLEEANQRTARRLLEAHVIESLQHIVHPRVSFGLPDLEAQVRFMQAQPPTAAGGLARSTEDLREEDRPRFDCAMKGGKKRTQKWIARNTALQFR